MISAPCTAPPADLSLAWEQAYLAWLDTKRRKSGSPHTVKAYAQDYANFFAFAAKSPWQVSSRDADAWLQHLTESGKAPATVNRKLAALSSFYAFVADTFSETSPGGECPLFCDAHGNPRPNPFRRPDRCRVVAYGSSRPLGVQAVRACLGRINRRSQTGARDYALIATYLYTGRRSAEIAALRWGDIVHDTARGRATYTWTGKGAQSRTDELPPPAWHAIRHYLAVTGRLDAIRPSDIIFRAIFTNRAERLPNVRASDPNRPLSGSMINRIVKRRFAAAGIPPADVHTHTLRHTAAALRYRDGHGQDLLEISAFLDHSSVAVTQIYLSRQHVPLDTGWTEVEALLAL